MSNRKQISCSIIPVILMESGHNAQSYLSMRELLDVIFDEDLRAPLPSTEGYVISYIGWLNTCREQWGRSVSIN